MKYFTTEQLNNMSTAEAGEHNNEVLSVMSELKYNTTCNSSIDYENKKDELEALEAYRKEVCSIWNKKMRQDFDDAETEISKPDAETLAYELNDVQREIENLDAADIFTENDFEDLLNEDTVEILGLEYPKGTALKNVDNIAFAEAYRNYVDANWSEIIEGSAKYNELKDEAQELIEEIRELEQAA